MLDLKELKKSHFSLSCLSPFAFKDCIINILSDICVHFGEGWHAKKTKLKIFTRGSSLMVYKYMGIDDKMTR